MKTKKKNKALSRLLQPKFSKKLCSILEDLKKTSGFEIRGRLRVVAVSNLDALAIIKGNTIYVNLKAGRYPKRVLRYIVSHEVAHIATRQHRAKFWETVERIYPDYEAAKMTLGRLQSIGKRSNAPPEEEPLAFSW